jgi:hypothetical protein
METMTYEAQAAIAPDTLEPAASAAAAHQAAIARLDAARLARQACVDSLSTKTGAAARRDARNRLTRLRDDVADAEQGEQDARRALTAARRVVFDQAKPVFETEWAGQLPVVEQALREARVAAQRLLDIECRAYRLDHGSSVAPAKSAIAGALGSGLLFALDRWLTLVQQQQQRPRSAA